ncbi:hypothetical protein FOD75_10780 (plasmid) [Limosilactobacillus reuteri]|uniref:Uncharacterized protein n=1 Tax=Limosilactobacillus reuteri TaxID=1598 RepID=A0A517D896_LIMRT|nr:hypothetical protein [Limosilactobacillus reuteri]QDR73575.1 hypothetical protein FOD75_10780 [Limosilactobacillus reuteri]
MMINTNLGFVIMIIAVALGLPIFTVLGLTYINRASKGRLAIRLGAASQVYIGGLGVIIHELSHLLMAVLFGHHIQDAKLLVMPWNIDRNGGALGYVYHNWNDRSLYQSLGNAFIGTAPIYGCTAALLLLTKWLNPALFQFGDAVAQSLVQATPNWHWSLVTQHLGMLTSGQWSFTTALALLLWVLLSVSITVGGFDLSPADFKNAGMAFIEMYVIITVILIILVYGGFSYQVTYWLTKWIVWFSLVMVISFIWSILTYLGCRLLALF